MDLNAYYDVINSESKARRYLLIKCFKTTKDFTLGATAENFTN
jgi:hypothetical protein